MIYDLILRVRILSGLFAQGRKHLISLIWLNDFPGRLDVRAYTHRTLGTERRLPKFCPCPHLQNQRLLHYMAHDGIKDLERRCFS